MFKGGISMDNIVITIARQYGSGGKTIGEMLSERMGVHFYNKELMKLASEDSGINESLFVNADEKGKPSKLFGISKNVYSGELVPPDSNDFTSTDNLFNYQAKVIRQLAETESCVIVGRAADFVLKDYDNVLSVYIEAPRAHCLKNIIRRMDVTVDEANELITKTDKYRADYYKFYTGGNYWTNPVNYDMTLNSFKLGDQKCVDIIKNALKVKFDGE